MQTLSRVREKFSGARESIVVTIYPVFSSQPWSQVELCIKPKFSLKITKSCDLISFRADGKRVVANATDDVGNAKGCWKRNVNFYNDVYL